MSRKTANFFELQQETLNTVLRHYEVVTPTPSNALTVCHHQNPQLWFMDTPYLNFDILAVKQL